MTDREEFEKWYTENKWNTTNHTKELMQKTWQARGELDAVRIKELNQEFDSEVIDFNNTIAELTAKLDKARENIKLALSLLEVNDMSDTYLMGNCITLAKQALELDK